jgi:hypothetical protein
LEKVCLARETGISLLIMRRPVPLRYRYAQLRPIILFVMNFLTQIQKLKKSAGSAVSTPEPKDNRPADDVNGMW